MPPTSRTLPTADQTIDEAFLTPRVIDKRAFDEYSAALQDLIREASGRGQTLQSAVVEVKSLSDNLREATKELKGRLETAVKVMPTLDQRVSRAEQILAAASGTRLAEHVEKTLEATVAAKIADLERRVGAIVSGAEQRLAAVDKALAGRMPLQGPEIEALVKAQVDQVQLRLAMLQEQALGQVQTAQNELQTQVAGVTERLATVQRLAAEKATALEAGINGHWEEVRARMAAMEKEVVTGTEGARSKAKAELEETLRKVEDRQRQIEERGAALEVQVKTKVDEARERIGAMDRDIQAGTAGVRQKARADLEDLLARVEAASKDVGAKSAEAQGAFNAALRQAREQTVDLEGRLERRLELSKVKAEAFLIDVQARADAAAADGVGLEERIKGAAVELETLLAQARERAASLARQADESAGEARRRLETQADDVVHRVSAAVKDAQGTLTPMQETTQRLVEEIDDRLGRVAWEYQSAVAPHVTRLEKLCEQAVRLSGSDGGPSAIGAITELSERAERLKEKAQFAVKQFEQVAAQAEHAREMMSDSILDAAARLDEQQARLELQQTRLDEQLGASQTVLANTSAAEEKMELAKRTQAGLERTLGETIELAQQAMAVISKARPAPAPEPVEAAVEVQAAEPEALPETPIATTPVFEERATEEPPKAEVQNVPGALPRVDAGRPMKDMFARLRAELER